METRTFLEGLNEHLKLRQFICTHSACYAEVFLLYMLKLGQLDIDSHDQFDGKVVNVALVANIRRLMRHMH